MKGRRTFRAVRWSAYAALVLGTSWAADRRADRQLRADLLQQARMVAVSICPDRVAVLAQKKVLVNANLDEVAATDDDWIREYFHGPRGRAAATAVAAAQAVPAATEKN